MSGTVADEPLLRVAGVRAGYQGQDVVLDVDLDVSAGEAVAVIGSNGAGKTTLFRTICGMMRASAGSIRFDGNDITGLGAHRVARAGLAYVPAERHLFGEMTVRDNLALGAFPSRPSPARLEMVFDLFGRLAERRRQLAGTMSGGEQQMLAVGRALMSEPKLLMLDEPTTGLAPKLAAEAYRALAALATEGLTVLVAEQQVPLALELADRGYVLENGRIGAAGSSDELADDPEVRRAYLGVS
ncbi:MAG: ABC transporter ATP-binding protein [Actinomycetota bacterium]|nr:ABC transporter ATP-binding protein [Actinomycetota bacterium]